MKLKTQLLLIATLILAAGCPIPPLTSTTKTDIPTTDTPGDDDDDTTSTEDTGG